MKTLVKNLKSIDSFFSSHIFGTSIGTYPIFKGLRGRKRLKKNASDKAYDLYKNHVLHIQEVNPSTLQLASQAAELLDQLESRKQSVENLEVIHQPHTLKVINYHLTDDKFGQNLDHVCLWLRDVLGISVTVISTLVWRNYHTADPSLFSGDWHFDRRPTNWYRLFIIASEEVDHRYGPFTYLNRQNSIKITRQGFTRKADNVSDYENIESNIFAGKRGNCVIVDTQYLLHRAGNPETGLSRDMIEIVFKV